MKQSVQRTALSAMVTASLAVSIAGLLSGCEAPPKPAPPAVTPAFTVPDNRGESTAMLVDRTNALKAAVAMMPGETGADHRQALVTALTELSKAVKLANGPVESPGFMNRVGVIEAAIKTASIQSVPRSRMEGVENQSLASAEKLLAEITTRYLYDDADLPPMLDTLTTACDTAMTSDGTMHDLDATEAFRTVANVMQQITDDMVARFGTTPTPDMTPQTPPPAAPEPPMPATPTPATTEPAPPATGPAAAATPTTMQ